MSFDPNDFTIYINGVPQRPYGPPDGSIYATKCSNCKGKGRAFLPDGPRVKCWVCGGKGKDPSNVNRRCNLCHKVGEWQLHYAGEAGSGGFTQFKFAHDDPNAQKECDMMKAME